MKKNPICFALLLLNAESLPHGFGDKVIEVGFCLTDFSACSLKVPGKKAMTMRSLKYVILIKAESYIGGGGNKPAHANRRTR